MPSAVEGEAVEVEVAEVVEPHEGRQAVDIVFASGVVRGVLEAEHAACGRRS